jgi:hypothetical protein
MNEFLPFTIQSVPARAIQECSTMGRLLRTLPLAFGLLIAACSDQNNSGVVAPEQPDLAGGRPAPTSLACNSSAFSSLINTYFSTATAKQAAQGHVNSMTAAPYGSVAQDNGFSVMNLIAAEVKGGNSAASTGNTLTRELIKCMYDATDVSSDFPANFATLDFTSSLDPNVPGAFEVRGPSSDRTPVASRKTVAVADRLSGVAPPQDPTDLVGPGTALPWNSILSERTLIYGIPLGSALAGYSKDQYQWEAIRPSVSFGGDGATVALCDPNSTPSSMVSESAFGVLAYTDGDYICDAVYAATVQGWSPRVLVQRMIKFVTPEPLSAGARTIGGSAGGLKSVFSKKTISSGKLKFLSFPASPKVNSLITVTVEARSSDDELMNGVTVTLTGTNNNGTNTKLVQWTGTACSDNSPPSGVTGNKGLGVANVGVAEIKFCVTKTGGLVLTGSGDVGDRTTIDVTQTKPVKLNVKP